MGKSYFLLIGDGMRSASSALRIVLSTTIACVYLDVIYFFIQFVSSRRKINQQLFGHFIQCLLNKI